ncbi:acyl carrier protein [Slackia isoflavoniconvertens]|uniref:acyl carrier protein n=1 Tax=Slackia isoflavoniconvertens TaxID=572010 RepID=UPI003A8EBA5F
MTTLETIQEILNENLDIDPVTVAVDSTFESLGIDSLDMVELVCEIENRFDIELGEAEGLDTVGKLVDYIDGLK